MAHIKRWFVEHLTWDLLKEGLIRLGLFGGLLAGVRLIMNLPFWILALIQLGLLLLIGGLWVRLRTILARGQAPVPKLTLLDFHHLRDDAPTVTYKLKLRVYLRNDFAVPLEIHGLTWTASTDEMQIQPPLRYEFQVENTPGAWLQDSWSTEAKSAVVRPGGVFRFWIGVNPAYDDRGIRRRHEIKEIGTVTLLASAAGKAHNLRVRL